MKKSCLFIAAFLLAFPFIGNAQDSYKCLLDDGKVWHESADYGAMRLECDLYLSGDTVIEGEVYRKLYERTTVHRMGPDSNSEEVAAPKLRVPIREEDQRVYIYTYGKHLLYDFTMQPGDVLNTADHEWVEVEAIDTIAVDGTLFRRFRLSLVQDKATAWEQQTGQQWPNTEPRIETENAFWVEGIGSDKGLTSLFAWYGEAAAYSHKSRFNECTEDGTCIFTAADFSAPAYRQGSINAIKEVIKPDSENTPVTNDLYGRRVIGSPRPGIYIQNGRKRVVSR